jgi:hypothetical protein
MKWDPLKDARSYTKFNFRWLTGANNTAELWLSGVPDIAESWWLSSVIGDLKLEYHREFIPIFENILRCESVVFGKMLDEKTRALKSRETNLQGFS